MALNSIQLSEKHLTFRSPGHTEMKNDDFVDKETLLVYSPAAQSVLSTKLIFDLLIILFLLINCSFCGNISLVYHRLWAETTEKGGESEKQK